MNERKAARYNPQAQPDDLARFRSKPVDMDAVRRLEARVDSKMAASKPDDGQGRILTKRQAHELGLVAVSPRESQELQRMLERLKPDPPLTWGHDR